MSSRAWIAGVVAVGAAGLGVLGAQTRARLPRALRAAVARGLGLAPEAVTLEHVRLGPGGLHLDGLSAGLLYVRTATFRPTLHALVGGIDGELRLEGIVLEDPPHFAGMIDRIDADSAEIELSTGQARARVHAVTLVPSGSRWPTLHVGEVGVELEAGRAGHPTALRRLAFTSLDAGPFHGLAGGGRLDEGALSLQAAGDGVRASVRAGGGELDGRIDLRRAKLGWTPVLAPLLARLGAPHGQLTLDGEIHAHRGEDDDELTIDSHLRVLDGDIALPRLAPVDVAGKGLTLTAKASLGDDLHAEGELTDGDAKLDLEATLSNSGRDESGDPAPTLSVRLEVPASDCGRLLVSLPPALRRALDGMGLEGNIAGRLALDLPLASPEDLALDGDLDLGCKVTSEPPLADATLLRTGSPPLPGAVDASGAARTFLLGPANPSFRRLAQIPDAVVDTLLAAEDGHFWHHKGLELLQLRRALAHDLAIGAAGRGGSTVTQQLAKNLFLSGERTLGRKLEEAVLAWRLESVLGKRRILELYLNLVELGPGIYGVEEGAQHWFGKPIEQLGAEQALQLAALLPAPRRGMDAAYRTRLDALRARMPGHAAMHIAPRLAPGERAL